MEVAILGGGVAGISSAIALKQAGFDVTVYERRESEKNIGAGIVIWPNAAYVLEQLKVLDEVKSVSGYPSSMRRISSKGEKLGSINIEEINHYMGYPSLSILRYDFQNILVSKLNALGVKIKYGYEITNIENKETIVTVHFENGEKTNADLLIGADGRMSSITRKYVTGNNKPTFQGFINWIGVFESDQMIFDEIIVKDYWGIGERFGIVPVSPYKAYWAGGISAKNIGARDSSTYKQELQSLFSNWPDLINIIISETPKSSINKIYVHDHNPIDKWHNKIWLLLVMPLMRPCPHQVKAPVRHWKMHGILQIVLLKIVKS